MFFFCNYGPESEFHIDIVCLVAEVVAFGSFFLRHVVFFQHVFFFQGPCGNSKLRARNVVTPGRETEGSFILGNRRKPHSAEQPHGSASSEASVAKTQKQVRAPGPARVD